MVVPLEGDTAEIPTEELWCGYPGENHPVSVPVTAAQRALLESGQLLLCPTLQANTVGTLPTAEPFGPADT